MAPSKSYFFFLFFCLTLLQACSSSATFTPFEPEQGDPWSADLRITGKALLKKEGESKTVSFELILARPERLYLRLSHPATGNLLSYRQNKENIDVLEHKNGSYRSFKNTAEARKDLFFALAPEYQELKSLFTGSRALMESPLPNEPKKYAFPLANGDKLLVHYLKFQQIEEMTFPKVLKVEIGEDSLKLVYQKVELGRAGTLNFPKPD